MTIEEVFYKYKSDFARLVGDYSEDQILCEL